MIKHTNYHFFNMRSSKLLFRMFFMFLGIGTFGYILMFIYLLQLKEFTDIRMELKPETLGYVKSNVKSNVIANPLHPVSLLNSSQTSANRSVPPVAVVNSNFSAPAHSNPTTMKIFKKHSSSITSNARNSNSTRLMDHICIAGVLLTRIYAGDKPELTTLEIEQWIRYLQFAGVRKIYLYDAYQIENETLQEWTAALFSPRRVVYHNWSKHTPYSISRTQISAYQHAIDNYKEDCEWHLAMDIDEYPFVLNDTKRGFLPRLVRQMKAEYPDCTELSFQNFIFSGFPKDYLWLIERMQRRYAKRFNRLDKPLYIARNVGQAQVHHNSLAKGRSIDIPSHIARMNHYWGARLQHWKPDTPATLSKTVNDSSMEPIIKELKKVRLFSHRRPVVVTNRYWTHNVTNMTNI